MRGQPIQVSGLQQGLNTYNAPYEVEMGQARDLLNVQSTLSGALKQRDGLVTFATPANTFVSLFALEETTNRFLIGTGSTFIYSVSTAGVVTQRQSGLTANAKWEWVAAPAFGGQGPLYGVNQTDTPQQWDGVAGTTSNWVATVGAIPNGKYMLQRANTTWVANTTAFPSRLFFSAIGDPRNWPAANVVDFDPNDGESITGIGTVGPYILVFKKNKAWVVYDLTTGANRPLLRDSGCASHRSIRETPQGTFFLSEDKGVFVTNGSTAKQVSDLVQPTLDLIGGGLHQQATATYFKDHYYLSFPTAAGANNRTLDYDLKLKSWWLHDIASNQFAVMHDSAGLPQLYSAKASSAIVDRCFVPATPTDNATAIASQWTSSWMSPTFYHRRVFPTPYFRKRLRQVRLDGSGSLDFYIAKDFAGAPTLWKPLILATQTGTTFGGTGTFGGLGTFGDSASATQKGEADTLGVARAFSIQLKSNYGVPWEVDAMTMFVTDRSN